MNYLPIIGLEIHVEPITKSKMFCGCDAHHFRVKPNTHTCPVCLGLPGALPVPNKKAIEACIKLGLALNCKINNFSKFDRKNYFYPDLPKGYQISQYDIPFCYQGEFSLPKETEKTTNNQFSITTIGITRVHQEEDTGKLVHQVIKGKKATLVDYNRSGVPLIEIVTEPDLRSAVDAKRFLKWLTRTIEFLGISDCDMEKGSMRLEANVSVKKLKVQNSKIKTKTKKSNFQELETRNWKLETNELPKYKVELKNINSFRYLEKAIEYEINRQIKILKTGKTPTQETRGYDEKKGITFSQRTKEQAQDYRYFPEPDIPPIKLSSQEITQIKKQINKLPVELALELVEKHHIRSDYAELLSSDFITVAKFMQLITQLPKDIKPSDAAKQIINQKLNLSKLSVVQLIKQLRQNKSSYTFDDENIMKIVKQVVKDNPKAVKDYQSGKTNVIGFLIGQVAKATKGQADPQLVKKIVEKKLSL